MKMIFRSIKILFACLAIYCFFASCKSSSKFTSKSSGTLLVAPIKIYYDPSESTLVLQQNGHDANYVQVNQNQTVKWDVHTSDLEIVEIAPDPMYVSSNDPNFFTEGTLHGNTKQQLRIIVIQVNRF